MNTKKDFAYLLIATCLLTAVVWVLNGEIYSGILQLIPSLVIWLATKYPEVPIYRILTTKILPVEEPGVSKTDLCKLRCFGYIRLALIGLAVFGLLSPFILAGYIGVDYENSKNPLTILILIMPILLLIAFIGALFNILKFFVYQLLR